MWQSCQRYRRDCHHGSTECLSLMDPGSRRLKRLRLPGYKDEVDKAQWACFGYDTAGFYWQYNIGPYGEGLYHKKTRIISVAS